MIELENIENKIEWDKEILFVDDSFYKSCEKYIPQWEISKICDPEKW